VLDGIGSGVFSATGQTTVVPEPGTLLLLSSALLLGIAQRRRFLNASRTDRQHVARDKGAALK